ncbi:MAG: T9SS type A sorting domain-containing protein [Fibromonadales bacterium]|nr:T9SS type A sorting domain-containing protein [Fibromonadales bacterium]
MKTQYLLPILGLAIMASQASAAVCKYNNKNAYCQWATGCMSIDDAYGEPAGKDCAFYIAACEEDGELFTDVNSSAINAGNDWGKGVICADNGGVSASGGGKKEFCRWDTGCYPIKNDRADCAKDGYIYEDVPLSGQGDNKKCEGGRFTGEGKTNDPDKSGELGYCYYGPCVPVPGNNYACEEGGGCFEILNEDKLADCQEGNEVVANQAACPAGSLPPGLSRVIKGHHAAGLLVAAHGRALHISSAKDANVTLYTLSGQQILSGVARAGNSVFSLMNQNPGVYYAVVQSGAYTQTVNVILK